MQTLKSGAIGLCWWGGNVAHHHKSSFGKHQNWSLLFRISELNNLPQSEILLKEIQLIFFIVEAILLSKFCEHIHQILERT